MIVSTYFRFVQRLYTYQAKYLNGVPLSDRSNTFEYRHTYNSIHIVFVHNLLRSLCHLHDGYPVSIVGHKAKPLFNFILNATLR